MISKEIIEKCQKSADTMRLNAIEASYRVGNAGAHIGGTLSMIEIMAALYIGVMKFDPQKPDWEERDRFILSKGHGVLAQYAALEQIGVISIEELYQFKKEGGRLYAHPSKNSDIGIEFSSGSLGQGVSQAVGTAIALKKKQSNSKVFVLVGDGECDEGSVWEALSSAAHFKLDNLTLIVDKNHLQYDGDTNDVLSMNSLEGKLEQFGFEVFSVDGHNIIQLLEAFTKTSPRPKAIVANTVKGKGVSFMENNPLWHNGRLSEKQYKQAISELTSPSNQ